MLVNLGEAYKEELSVFLVGRGTSIDNTVTNPEVFKRLKLSKAQQYQFCVEPK